MGLNQTWNMDLIFAGGSHSESYEKFLKELESNLGGFQAEIEKLGSDATALPQWNSVLQQFNSIDARFGEAFAFVECLTAQDVRDTKASALEDRMMQSRAVYENALNSLDAKLLELKGDVWDELLQQPAVSPIQEAIVERRTLAAEKLDVGRESLISDLSVDGYHAWGSMYSTLVGKLKIPVTKDGETVQMSAGQAANQLTDKNRDFREEVFANWEEAWGNQEDLFARTLNHLAGSRLAVYKQRNWPSVLQEPLEVNRMSEQTLNTMWKVISENKAPFAEFLKRKAQLYGVEKPTWSDVEAPVGDIDKSFTYDEARDFIVEHFSKFNPDLAEFANVAFENRWIEAEDRDFKRPGGFCTSFPLSEQSRIFLTFSGTLSNVATIAHELGHAYHQYVMKGMPQLVTHYAMNVAETASTFAEMIVADAALKAADSDEERIHLLADKLERSVAFYMNIHSRFLFETRFYEARKQGFVDAAALNKLMVDAQKEAFADVLGEYHPHFWAAKLHFHITDVPFYNFPYTFGYMFSTGIYARALAEGPSFADKYVALLRDTGRMQVEDLAQKHLGVDLTKPDFWKQAIDLGIQDVNEFLRLTDPSSH
ncbi:M3 family oligoendopeptidase [Alicyclobacillus sp. SO9]|uniref:M3 family oligoendopeptidase n=1 Tax=Alicyclobacillus sp. SO9 TaxID=2665646 RepID=UPI0018E8CE08|nr:M3 family oligoendopeptidase [Alicyclobacillus sp. SO9]QQE78557.1 M3 family oligoendopeptidase [Alicyclobacillus sp. SO9]